MRSTSEASKWTSRTGRTGRSSRSWAESSRHWIAPLESPTGTGKSLSLLCSTLAWQQNCKTKNRCANPSPSKPAPEAMTDPLAYGGGFVPEVEPSGNPGPENLEPAQSAANSKNQKKKATPTLYYASSVHKIKGHPSLQKGGCHEAHDIEDLVKVGQVVKGCSDYAARSMADDAQLVFCSYNNIINPVIRGAMEVDIEGAIVILDEAHNIEDIARDAGSVDVEEVLHKLQMELEQLCAVDVLTYQPLYEMTKDLINWIERRKITLEKREFQRHVSWMCYKDVDEDFLAAKDSSKNLSDYMLYLLVMRPIMLPIGIGMIRFRDTCKEAKQFFKERGISSKDDDKLRRMLLRVCTEVEPTKVKGDRSKSVLFVGCLLANQLQKPVDKEIWNKEKKWEFICNVWIEILGYAASHCKGYFHAQQLARAPHSRLASYGASWHYQTISN